MTLHLIAVHNYGSHRVKDSITKKKVSAYKIGYSGATSKVLLALFKDKARDVSSKRASYHYIHIDKNVQVKQGYILLRLTDAEVQTVENITRNHHHAAVFRWKDGQWLAFPTNQKAEYHTPRGSYPRFDGTGIGGTQPLVDDTNKVGAIVVERSQHDPNKPAWFWLSGDTYPHRTFLKSMGCRWSKRRKSWYYVGDKLPDKIQLLIDKLNEQLEAEPEIEDDAPCSDAEAEAILGVKLTPKVVTPPIEAKPATEVETEEMPAIRVIPAPTIPDDGELDDIQQAIRSTKVEPRSIQPQTAISHKTRANIGQEYVGDLTGAIAGNVMCFGYAIHDGTLIYLNLGGPRMAVEAIRARLLKGEIVNLTPWDAPAIELTAGEGNMGMFTDFSQNITEARFQHTILLHELLMRPNYGGASTTFIIRTSEEQARMRLKQHVTDLVKCAVFDAWTDYLWQAGQHAMLIRPTRSAGGIDLLTISLDADAWLRLITGGLAEGLVNLPEN